MAHRAIREYDAKRLLSRFLGLDYKGVLIKGCDFAPAQSLPWIEEQKLVVKVDQLFGKRAEYGLVGLNLSWEEVKEWIREHCGKEVCIGRKKGRLEYFLVEPFIAHEEEHYLCIRSTRNGEEILYSNKGGTGIEERWDAVKKVEVGVDEGEVNLGNPALNTYLSRLLTAFRELDFASLEINPLALPGFYMLDAVAEVDDYAHFKNMKAWDFEFPPPFGKHASPEERKVEELDKRSGASMKLSVLNEKGKIWLLTAGGGASIVYADSIKELGLGEQLANYGEYSGNPSAQEMEEYSSTIFSLMEKHPFPKYLIIGGAIANFTDVAATFKGVVEAIRKHAPFFKKWVTVIVRRGGINAEKGLAYIKSELDAMGIKNYVYSEEKEITYPAKLIKQLEG